MRPPLADSPIFLFLLLLLDGGQGPVFVDPVLEGHRRVSLVDVVVYLLSVGLGDEADIVVDCRHHGLGHDDQGLVLELGKYWQLESLLSCQSLRRIEL